MFHKMSATLGYSTSGKSSKVALKTSLSAYGSVQLMCLNSETAKCVPYCRNVSEE